MKKLLGQQVQDTVTGVAGMVTAYGCYLNGCEQVLITPVLKDNSLLPAIWVNVQQITILEKTETAKEKPEPTGGPQTTPPGQSHPV